MKDQVFKESIEQGLVLVHGYKYILVSLLFIKNVVVFPVPRLNPGHCIFRW